MHVRFTKNKSSTSNNFSFKNNKKTELEINLTLTTICHSRITKKPTCTICSSRTHASLGLMCFFFPIVHYFFVLGWSISYFDDFLQIRFTRIVRLVE